MKTFQQAWDKMTSKVELIQVHSEEMEAMWNKCLEFKEPFIVEIGSAHGASSIIFAEVARKTHGVVHCYDTYPENYYNQDKFGRYAKEQFIKNTEDYVDVLMLHQASSTEVGFMVLTNYIDVAFIDGDHSYEAVQEDCHNIIQLIRKGGYIAFHDYNNPAFAGVKKAADEQKNIALVQSVWDLAIFKKL